MDCQYCHFEAERGAHAAVPPLSVCMNCHATVGLGREWVLKMKEYWDRGEPIPWKKTPLTPNLGVDETDDMRGGMGLQGLTHLRQFLEDGGVFIPITAGAALPNGGSSLGNAAAPDSPSRSRCCSATATRCWRHCW